MRQADPFFLERETLAHRDLEPITYLPAPEGTWSIRTLAVVMTLVCGAFLLGCIAQVQV